MNEERLKTFFTPAVGLKETMCMNIGNAALALRGYCDSQKRRSIKREYPLGLSKVALYDTDGDTAVFCDRYLSGYAAYSDCDHYREAREVVVCPKLDKGLRGAANILRSTCMSSVSSVNINAAEPNSRMSCFVMEPDGDSRESVAIVLVNHEGRRVYVLGCCEGYVRKAAMRSIRAMAMVEYAHHEYLLIHGGCIEHEGSGIAVVGHRRAGKTTTVLSCISSGMCAFIANDKVFLGLDSNGQSVCHGLPVSSGIRAGTIEGVRELMKRSQYSVFAKRWRERAKAITVSHEEERCYVTPQELRRWTGCGLTQQAPLKGIVFPRYSPDRSSSMLRKMTSDAAITAISPHVQDVWFPEQPYWHSEVMVRDRSSVASRLKAILARCRCYELFQNEHTNSHSVNLLRRAFDSGDDYAGKGNPVACVEDGGANNGR
jgi:hypothetical protein